MEALQRLLDALADDTEAVTDHLAALSASEVDSLVRAVPRVQHEEGTIELTQLLLHLPSRHDTIRSMMEMILEKKLSSRWATELCMGYMTFTDAFVSSPEEALASDIDATIGVILQLLDVSLRDDSTRDATSFQAVLDSLPNVVSLAPPSRTKVATMLDAILALPWSLTSFPCLLAFCKATASQCLPRHHTQLQAMCTAYMPHFGTQLSYAFWHDTLLACFELSDDAGDRLAWISLARRAIIVVPAALHRDMDFLVQTIFQQSPIYMARWRATVVDQAESLTPWDYTLYLHALHASQPLFQHVVRDTMFHQLARSFRAALLLLVQSEEEDELHKTLQRMLVHASHWKGRVLLDLARLWVDADDESFDDDDVALLVSTILLTVFHEVVELRQEVLRFVLAGFDTPSSSTKKTDLVFPAVLDALVTTHVTELQPHLHDLQERIACVIPHLFGSSGTPQALVHTCLPLVFSTPSYFHFLMVLLRKQLVSPAPAFAIAHWCAILQAASCSPAQAEDIAACVNDALYLTSCRHLALAHLRALPSVALAPFENAITQCLHSLVHVDDEALTVHTERLDPHSGVVLRHCLDLLGQLSPASQTLAHDVATQLTALVSRAHCRTFLATATADPTDAQLAMAFYANVAHLATTTQADGDRRKGRATQLRCMLVTNLMLDRAPFDNIDDDASPIVLTTDQLLDAMGGCCAHWTAWCLAQLERRLAALTPTQAAALAGHTVEQYVVWHSADVIVAHDVHPMDELKFTRKPIRPHELMTQMLRLWKPLHDRRVMTPALWHVDGWKPVRQALVQQLTPLLATQGHVGLSLAIAEYLYVLYASVDPTLAVRGAGQVYRLACSHIVSSPKLVHALLQLAWLEPKVDVKWQRVHSVLVETTIGNDDDEAATVPAPVLSTAATRRVAYIGCLKQIETALAAAAEDEWSCLVPVLGVAWRDGSVSYTHATHAMDALLRVGKTALGNLRDRFTEQRGVVETIVRVCIDVGAAWKDVPQVADVSVRMQKFVLDVSSLITSNLKKRVWPGKYEPMLKDIVQNITKHVMAMSDLPPKKGARKDMWVEPRKKKRVKLRSRHAFIDDCLREEGGDDAFADLEDFLV
ncbi:Aste57867_20731 [Aphanomyces stellatus]|uniref:Aste57867_20731 protein n=1 Tax=Aphanomyces stellatus TaxID=120398 RepID=A0A485LFT4_9STRA|nr:hypothetical protein As57867_020663 [Aphanomyces stellatus]VFT97411.1 Aste57867_20731 [Aphanomyces stellatus]